MGEVCTPKYLADLVPTHGWLRSQHLCQMPLDGGEAYPVRTWLSCWNRATHTDMQRLCRPHCVLAVIILEVPASMVGPWTGAESRR